VEQFARVGEVELCWQQFGAGEDPPMLLIAGLGAQMILWPDGFCERLADRGFQVIRFDNRDAGRSTVLHRAGSPSVRRALDGDLSEAAYTLSEMAADAVGLLEALGIERAHLVGTSLGGMVAQMVAIEYPWRVRSLASIMSTTGDRSVGGATPEGLEALTTAAPADREGYIETTVRLRKLIGSPGFAADDDYLRAIAASSFDRGYHPDGTARQVVAIVATGDRTPRLRELDLPTVVIHGDSDPLIDVSGGRATAAAIRGAELVVIPGMGHNLPEETWPTIVDAIVANAQKATTEEG
jgi:pimeloyl-ACP methyl ester carboxylesterase